MDDTMRYMMSRLPLAIATFELWNWVTDSDRLQQIWDEHRGRCYDRLISFPVMVNVILDALVSGKSGCESFRDNIKDEVLDASMQAAYGKLGRIPIAVTQALLQVQTKALEEVFPEWAEWKRPASLKKFRIVTYDGKAIKRVAKRLKAARGARGGLLGGRALVATCWDTGMAIAMHGDPDGEANDVKFVKDLVPVINEMSIEPVLHVGDAGFCDLEQPRHFTARKDNYYLVRHHPKVKFHPDPEAEVRQGKSYDGTPYEETLGWLGSEGDKRRHRVRRIVLLRPNQDAIALITDLIDWDRYDAIDLLFVYRERWGIERMFQKVTEVFGLSHLIGTTPQATLFQFALCMMLYNMMQLMRGYVAQGQSLEPHQISTELMFRDVVRQVNAWDLIIDRQETADYFSRHTTAAQLKKRLAETLIPAWTTNWLASPPQAVHRQTPRKKTKTHTSVHRLIHGPPIKKKRKNLKR